MTKAILTPIRQALLFPVILLSVSVCAGNSPREQSKISNLERVTAPVDFDNVHLIPLGSDKHASEYLIFIKKRVAAHYHAGHTEIVYVLDGEGVMTLGEHKKQVKKGDYIRIPQGKIHAVEVTSKEPMKVLSVQTPEFKGKDRIFVSQE
ncbi:cupin domain-containing protein [Thalassomonas haliotis]|uniref:Cupin domain-containing protein n=1 Tax=Thalassomonas haliotis TaxID=485448 RepID=A0ABY7VHP7_9GAMM|nr:cupin domain-containing protein [Thalassomonas haliotis]WDE13020.1 cupin domain-containing protein [Thalassomonas haliotis]